MERHSIFDIKILLSSIFVFFALLSFTPPLVTEVEAIEISSFYGKYDSTQKKGGQQALSLRGPKIEKWKPPKSANKPYHIGVSFPHIKDSYWLAVNHGVIDEAQKIGVAVTLLEAGGYTNLPLQQKQLRELKKTGVDGIILGSISYKKNDAIVSELNSSGIPVIEVINDIEAPEIKAKSLVSFYDMGFFAGEFVAETVAESEKKEVSVLFLPGPKGSGWADETLEGFKAATEFSPVPIRILDVKWGDTGTKTQTALLRQGFSQHKNADFVVGNAVAADAATEVLKEKGVSSTVVSTYITPQVYDKIKEGLIAASPSDMTVDQARIAVGMMIRLLNGETPGTDFPFRAGPLIPVISAENIGDYPFERLFGPRDFTPIFNLKP